MMMASDMKPLISKKTNLFVDYDDVEDDGDEISSTAGEYGLPPFSTFLFVVFFKPSERLIKKYNGNKVAFQIMYSTLTKRRNDFYSSDPQKVLAIIHSIAILAFIVRFYFLSKRPHYILDYFCIVDSIFFSRMTVSEEAPLSRKVTPDSAGIQTNNVLCIPQVVSFCFWTLCFISAYVDERSLGTLDSIQTKFFQHYDYHIFNRFAYYKIDPQFILGIIYTIATIVLTLRCFVTAINGYFRNRFIFAFDTYIVCLFLYIAYKGVALALYAKFYFDDYCLSSFINIPSSSF
uniref:Uncharacterized protein n=1 Tax=Panagrolaimus sp. PS1159 TaxID=55785 RepID=A0AC35GNS7_9BILA